MHGFVGCELSDSKEDQQDREVFQVPAGSPE
jgi:hypothetical protein